MTIAELSMLFFLLWPRAGSAPVDTIPGWPFDPENQPPDKRTMKEERVTYTYAEWCQCWITTMQVGGSTVPVSEPPRIGGGTSGGGGGGAG